MASWPSAGAAFSTPPGEFAPVVKTDFGFHVIQVTDAREAGVRPFDEVREELLQSLTAQRSQERVAAEAERLHTELDGGADIATVAQREGLDLVDRFVTEGERLGDIGAAPDFITSVFAVEPGNIASPLRVAAGMALVLAERAAVFADGRYVADLSAGTDDSAGSLAAALEAGKGEGQLGQCLDAESGHLGVRIRLHQLDHRLHALSLHKGRVAVDA